MEIRSTLGRVPLRPAAVAAILLAVATGCGPALDSWSSPAESTTSATWEATRTVAPSAPAGSTNSSATRTPVETTPDAPPTTVAPPTTAPPTTTPPPVSSSWPGPGNAGYRSLSQSSGTIKVTQAGTVIDGYDVTGSIVVAANNVTIRNTRIRTSGRYGIAPAEGVTGLVIEDVTVIGTGWDCSAGIAPDGSWTLRRSDISGCVDGIKVRSNQVVESNWVHGLRMGYQPDGTWAHNDALQSTSGANVTIRGNNFEVDWAGGANGAVMMSSNFGSLQNYTLDGNRFAGGQFVVSIRDQGYGDPRGIVITNNTWVYGDWHYGPTNFSGTSVTLGAGNHYDNGTPM